MIWKKIQFLRYGAVFFVMVLSSLIATNARTAWAQAAADANAKTAPDASGQAVKDNDNEDRLLLGPKVNEINVLATVRDKHGKIVNNLGHDDFILTEDDRPQTLRFFTSKTDLPLTLGLLVDTSLSQRRVLDDERSASSGFFNRSVREDKDKAFIIHFDREVELLQDLTASHEKLQMAIGELQSPRLNRTREPDDNPPDSDPQSGRGQGRRGMRHEDTLLYDAIYLASDEMMQKQQWRKILVVITDGVDRGSKESLMSAIESAQRANTLVYTIWFKDDGRPDGSGGLGHPGIGFPGQGRGGVGFPGGGGGGGRGRYPRPENEPRTDGKKILEQISKQTGGRLFEVSKKQPISQIFAEIEEEMSNQYSFGYKPDLAGANGPGYHKIQLTTKDKGFVVQAREGYYAEK